MMKKMIAVMLLTGSLYAGGSLPEIEPITYVEVDTAQPSPFYAGIGFGIDEEIGRYYSEYDSYYDYDIDEGYSNVSLFLGAVVAREGSLALAIEARAAATLDDYGVDSWGIYAKPEIEAGDIFTMFGILGYQRLTAYDIEYDALGLGIGGVFMFNDNVGVQFDYIYSVIEEDEYGFTPEYANATASLLYKF